MNEAIVHCTFSIAFRSEIKLHLPMDMICRPLALPSCERKRELKTSRSGSVCVFYLVLAAEPKAFQYYNALWGSVKNTLTLRVAPFLPLSLPPPQWTPCNRKLCFRMRRAIFLTLSVGRVILGIRPHSSISRAQILRSELGLQI